jgi:hypothetical protein
VQLRCHTVPVPYRARVWHWQNRHLCLKAMHGQAGSSTGKLDAC